MPRNIIAPPDFSGAALAALKAWLAISTPGEDALLVRLLASAHDTCARFTGLMPLGCGVEETLAPASGWMALVTRPVRAFASVTWFDADGAATVLDHALWSQSIEVNGAASIRLKQPPSEGRIVVSVTAGVAESWETIPPALGDGIVRLAAHAYRARDGVAGEPPAVIAALWRAWRELRL